MEILDTKKEICSIKRLEEIRFLIKELTHSFIICEIEVAYHNKEYVVDYFNCLFQELKSLSNVEDLLENFSSPTQLKNEIELAFKTINRIDVYAESFNLCDDKIKEIKTLLNALMDAVYVEIGNRLCERIYY